MNPINALSDETRIHIIGLLANNRIMNASEIAENFKMSKPAISQHLKVLKTAGLVNMEIDGQKRLYSINPNGIKQIDTWLDTLKANMESQADRLEQFIEAGKDLDS